MDLKKATMAEITAEIQSRGIPSLFFFVEKDKLTTCAYGQAQDILEMLRQGTPHVFKSLGYDVEMLKKKKPDEPKQGVSWLNEVLED